MKSFNEYFSHDRIKLYREYIIQKKYWVSSGLLVIIAVFSFLFLNSPVNHDQTPVSFAVREGSSARDIAAELKSKGIIRNETIFELFAKVEGLDSKLKVGSYTLSSSLSMQSIVSILASGKMSANGITIPEGYTVEQIADLLVSKGVLENRDQFLELAKDFTPYNYMERRPQVKYACEGFLFPETYDFAVKTPALEVLKRLTREFDQKLDANLRQQAAQEKMSIYDLVTMASLVEREAKLKDERPEVASVFLNRLAINMPLQSCATVQYVLAEHKDVLSISDTQIDSPYNTYERNGLPVGPIANPGLACIKAVLNPAKTDYLFFVVNGKGGHYFAKTYEEHEKNIARGEN
ncbi:MAG: endolytic transglycosylase MltG [Bacillota bacterium]